MLGYTYIVGHLRLDKILAALGKIKASEGGVGILIPLDLLRIQCCSSPISGKFAWGGSGAANLPPCARSRRRSQFLFSESVVRNPQLISLVPERRLITSYNRPRALLVIQTIGLPMHASASMGLDASRLDVLARVLFSFTKLIQEAAHHDGDRLARGTTRTARPRQDKAVARKEAKI